MYREIFEPSEENHSIDLPEKFYGKKVEVIVTELKEPLTDSEKPSYTNLPKGKKVSKSKLFESFGANPDFPDIDEIRKQAWPERW